jgi:hypothetical protein
MTRSKFASLMGVNYLTVYRWLEKGIRPRRKRVSGRSMRFLKNDRSREKRLNRVCRVGKDPIQLLRGDKTLLDRFILRMTLHSNAIEGSRMSLQDYGKRLLAAKSLRAKSFLK